MIAGLNHPHGSCSHKEMIAMPTLRRLIRTLLVAPRASLCAASAVAVLCLAVFSAAAQQPIGGQVPTTADAEAKAEEPPTPAELLIDAAKAKLAKLTSCSAELVETVDMLNQPTLTFKGRFRKAPDYRVYFLLTLSGLPETTGTALQICDGDTLWDYQAIMESTLYRKFSIKPVMERINAPEIEPKMREQFKENIGFAGPEVLLAGLRRLFRFDQEKEEGKLGDKAVWILRGTWKSRQGLTGPNQQQVNLLGLLPPYIPSDAILYLGKDDGWPYKLVLAGRKRTLVEDTRKKGPDGRYIGSKSSIEIVAPTKIVLEYSDVQLNPTLNPALFAFSPPGSASVDDGTEMIIRQIDAVIAHQASQKKDETSKKEGPVLDQSLEIPPPPATTPPAGQSPTP
jgi:hypothetical protein